MNIRGLQYSNLDGNQTANDRYWQNNKVLLLAKCMKLYTFLSVCIYSWQETLIRHEQFFFSKIHLGYQKTQNFMLISKMLTRRQNKSPKKSYRQ